MKKCVKCKKTKPMSDFYMRGSGESSWPRSACRVCMRAMKFAKNSGVTVNLEDIEELLIKSKGVCAICKKDGVTVDHDHTTGRLRGILCSKCNLALGLFEDSTVILEKAIKYLKKS